MSATEKACGECGHALPLRFEVEVELNGQRHGTHVCGWQPDEGQCWVCPWCEVIRCYCEGGCESAPELCDFCACRIVDFGGAPDGEDTWKAVTS